MERVIRGVCLAVQAEHDIVSIITADEFDAFDAEKKNFFHRVSLISTLHEETAWIFTG